MVVFACNTCGESLKKNQVEVHLYRARCRNSFVSCMDCTKDFNPESYKLHIKCVTEDEKYSGGKFKPKDSTLNGERKREAWMEIIQNVFVAAKKQNPDSKVVNLLQYLAGMQSVPAREKTFRNFLQNSCKHLIGQAGTVWNMLQKEKTLLDSKNKPEPPKNPPVTENSCNGKSKDLSGNEKQNGETEEPIEKKKKSKKRKENGIEKEEETNDQEVPDVNQKLKKKKKSRKSEANEEEEEEVAPAPSLNEGQELSGKELKKQKKKEKYQQLLSKIESGADVTEDARPKKKKKKSKTEVSENGDDHVPKDKKKKKKKSKNVEEDGENVEETIVKAVETETVSKKSKKRKNTADTEEQEDMLPDKKCRLNDTLGEVEVQSGGKFNWKATIEQILQGAKHTRLPMKKLKRKVLSAYEANGGDPADKQLTDNKVGAKFDKMLSKMQNVTIDNQSVCLVNLEL